MPTRIRIPALEVDAAVLPIQAPGRHLVPPADPATLGWWAGGALPGAARGSALVAGHTVHSGGGALDDLETLREGDEVTVRAGGRTVDYVVERVQVLGKGILARRAGTIFSQSVRGRLVLLTCEDWDGSSYLSNVVVTALPRS